MEHIISRHGVPAELLSDCGANFLSKLMQEVCKLMGIHKVNKTAYHPETDGLVERFNRTLIDMLAKTVEKNGRDWDVRLPYILFAYRASMQDSTQDSAFYLLYGRDPKLPTDAAMCTPVNGMYVEIDDYKSELTVGLMEAWKLAHEHILKAQRHQKKFHDCHSRMTSCRVGDRVFVLMPAAKAGKAHKFARPFHGPYRVLEVTTNNAPIFVALERIRHCPEEIPEGETWPPSKNNPLAGGNAFHMEQPTEQTTEHS